MLAYYAERFPTVEINYTFYRMPTEKLLAGWAAGTPDGFTFTLKAPRRITHDAKLQRCEDTLQAFCRTARPLGPKLAVLLFQLPPNFKKNADVLREFVELLPEGTRAAFEFRHPSWFDAETYDTLRSRNVALCVADSEKMSTPVETTADYAYLRLRDEGYQQADIERWAASSRRCRVRRRSSTSSTKSRASVPNSPSGSWRCSEQDKVLRYGERRYMEGVPGSAGLSPADTSERFECQPRSAAEMASFHQYGASPTARCCRCSVVGRTIPQANSIIRSSAQ